MRYREPLVDEVIALLSPLTPKVAQVERMPEKANYQQFKHPAAAVWVAYNGQKSQERSSSPSNVLRNAEVRFDLIVLTRSLNGPKGCAAIVDAVEELIDGARLTMGSPLMWLDDSFGGADLKQGVWRYDVMIGMQLPRVLPVPDYSITDPQTGPALKFVTLENTTDGDTSVGVDPG